MNTLQTRQHAKVGAPRFTKCADFTSGREFCPIDQIPIGGCDDHHGGIRRFCNLAVGPTFERHKFPYTPR